MKDVIFYVKYDENWGSLFLPKGLYFPASFSNKATFSTHTTGKSSTFRMGRIVISDSEYYAGYSYDGKGTGSGLIDYSISSFFSVLKN